MIFNGKNFELVIGYKLVSCDRVFSFDTYFIRPSKTCKTADCGCGCSFPYFYFYFSIMGITLLEFSLFKFRTQPIED